MILCKWCSHEVVKRINRQLKTFWDKTHPGGILTVMFDYEYYECSNCGYRFMAKEVV